MPLGPSTGEGPTSPENSPRGMSTEAFEKLAQGGQVLFNACLERSEMCRWDLPQEKVQHSEISLKEAGYKAAGEYTTTCQGRTVIRNLVQGGRVLTAGDRYNNF